MSRIIAQIGRPLIIWISQLAVTSAAFALVEKVLDALQNKIRETFDLSEDDAWAYISNIFADTIALVGIGTAVLYKRIPLRIADKIGLSATKVTRKKVSQTAAKKIATGGLETSINKLQTTVTWVGGIAGTYWAFMAIPQFLQQIGDQAIFQRKNANDYWESITGIRPFTEPSPLDSPGRFKSTEFDDYERSLTAAGAQWIQDPRYGMPLPFNRTNLAKLIDYVTGVTEAAGKKATPAEVKPKIAPYITLKTNLGNAGMTTTPKVSTVPVPAVTPVKIYTGTVAQGTLGNYIEFTPRQDDLIEDAGELKMAAQNNVAPFIASLPGKLVYELKVVSSVTTKDGFTQHGSVQRIVSGYYKDGTPKYRNVVNKWAVMDIFIKGEGASRTKLSRIVLGPTDATKFNPTQSQSDEIASALYTSAPTTTSQNSVSSANNEQRQTSQNGLQSTQNDATIPSTAQNTVINRQYFVEGDGFVQSVMFKVGTTVYTTDFLEGLLTDAEKQKFTSYGEWIPRIKEKMLTRGLDIEGLPRVRVWWEENGKRLDVQRYNWEKFFYERLPGETGASIGTRKNTAGADAINLSEWFQANGLTLPSVSERSKMYETFGLGSATLYVGTAEQNARFLAALKAKAETDAKT